MINVRDQFPIEPGWPRLEMDWGYNDLSIVIHHTAVLFPAANMTMADEMNHIRVIHLYHKSKGWGGFGYHLIIFPSGRTYYVVDLHRWGAHVANQNNRRFGIVAAGNFIDTPPSPAQFEGVWAAVEFIMGSVHIMRVDPHSYWTDTSCPGKAWPLPEEEEDDMGIEWESKIWFKDEGEGLPREGVRLMDILRRFRRDIQEGGDGRSNESIAASLKIVPK